MHCSLCVYSMYSICVVQTKQGLRLKVTTECNSDGSFAMLGAYHQKIHTDIYRCGTLIILIPHPDYPFPRHQQSTLTDHAAFSLVL